MGKEDNRSLEQIRKDSNRKLETRNKKQREEDSKIQQEWEFSKQLYGVNYFNLLRLIPIPKKIPGISGGVTRVERLRLEVGEFQEQGIDEKPICVSLNIHTYLNLNPNIENDFLSGSMSKEKCQYFPPEIDSILYRSLRGKYKNLERISEIKLGQKLEPMLELWVHHRIKKGSLPKEWESAPHLTLNLLDSLFGIKEIDEKDLLALLNHPYEEIVLLAVLAIKNKLPQDWLKAIYQLRFESQNVLTDGFLEVIGDDQISKGYTEEKLSLVRQEAVASVKPSSLFLPTISYLFRKFFGKK